jgi:flagellar biosynthesis/type III secretory pathway protein FliH
MRDIETQARSLLLRARQQADQFLAAAQTEADAMKRQAHASGLTEGRRDGLDQGRAEGLKSGHEQALNETRAALTTAITALTQAAKQIDDSRRQLESAALTDVINLAIAIAQRVTKRQGVLDPSIAISNAVEAMKLVAHASDLRIAIHPSQKATLDAEMPRLRLQFPSLQHVELVTDETLAPGGCRIFTTQGQIDASLDQQIDRIVNDLLPQRQEVLA